MNVHAIEYRFEPVLSAADWFALTVPIALAAFIYLWAFRFVRSKRNSSGLKTASILVVLALLLVTYAHLPRLTTLTFRGKELRSSWLAFEKRYHLADSNSVRVKRGAIELCTPQGTITLPTKATWRAEDLQVDAAFLANEFAGRSGKRN